MIANIERYGSFDIEVHKKLAPQLWGASLTFQNVGRL